jgi:hypothetical protein
MNSRVFKLVWMNKMLLSFRRERKDKSWTESEVSWRSCKHSQDNKRICLKEETSNKPQPGYGNHLNFSTRFYSWPWWTLALLPFLHQWQRRPQLEARGNAAVHNPSMRYGPLPLRVVSPEEKLFFFLVAFLVPCMPTMVSFFPQAMKFYGTERIHF